MIFITYRMGTRHNGHELGICLATMAAQAKHMMTCPHSSRHESVSRLKQMIQESGSSSRALSVLVRV